MIPKVKVFIKSLKWRCDVESVHFGDEEVLVDLSNGQGDFSEYNFNEVLFLNYINKKDSSGNELYVGDVVKYIKGVHETIGVIIPYEEELTYVLAYEDGAIGFDFTPYQKGIWSIELLGNVFDDSHLIEKYGLEMPFKELTLTIEEEN